MSELKSRFEQAVASTSLVTQRPSNTTLLKLYAFYKQATEGDNEVAKPGFGDMVARAKWDAWKKLEGTSADEAMQQYVALMTELIEA
ncbi:acyl-CoA-binding protein [Ottowia sp.]|uniref:acyl-CoA-binding protein n=1 Tax=Ottowia sp. TaxID=1898956 RepID=UPI003A8B2823